MLTVPEKSGFMKNAVATAAMMLLLKYIPGGDELRHKPSAIIINSFFTQEY